MVANETYMPECYWCGRSIPLGEPYMSIDYHLERSDDGLVITVELAESLLTGCIDHAPSRQAIGEALSAAVFPIPGT